MNEIEKIAGLERLVGNTPFLEIKYKFKGEERVIYSKAEYYNYTGSIKDRIALQILKQALFSGEIMPQMDIVEATSGNTGISFSAFGRALGHKVRIYMPDWMSSERIQIMKSFGAEVILVSKEQGGFLGSIALAEKERTDRPNNVFLPRQFDNCINCKTHYLTTAPEIYKSLSIVGKELDCFVAGVGTGGTIMGVSAFFKDIYPKSTIHPLEPSNSPTLSSGHKVGKHRIQGISDEFIPSIVDLTKLDKIISVDDGDAIIMAQKIAKQLGLGVGISSGANFIGAVMLQNQYGANKTVATVFSDDNKKYLTTDYIKQEPLKDTHISSHIDLLSVRSM